MDHHTPKDVDPIIGKFAGVPPSLGFDIRLNL